MTIPIRPDAPISAPLPPVGATGATEAGDATAFGDLLTRALGNVQATQDHRDDIITAFLQGKPVELHDVMSAAEEASISLQLLVETRNKLTDAYRTIMNMQV